MAATIDVIKTYGTTGTPTEVVVTSPGLLSTNDNAAPSSSPVVVPMAGTNYSYECWLRFKCTVAPATQVTNFKIWSDGAAVATGVVITVNTDAVTTFATPVVTDSTQGTRDDFANHGSGAKINVAGTLVNVGDKSDFSVFQLEVGTTASPGNISETVTFQYDET